jgi:hypothetical protein
VRELPLRGAARCSSGARPRECHLRHGDGADHGVEDPVGRDALGERLVAEHEAVAERVLRERADVVGGRVVAAADERERA